VREWSCPARSAPELCPRGESASRTTGHSHGMSDPDATTRRRRKRLADECAEARVYRDLAARRASVDEREILLGLAEAEERHAAHWQALLGDAARPALRGDVRLRLLALLARHFGSVFVLALAQRAERRASQGAATDVDTTPAMVADELVHAEVVRGLAARGREQASGTFRAAVFGANDGLVSNLALVLGVSGGGVGAGTVLLTGLAGLLAGALSMGAGEYISVRSQRELLAASAPDPASPQVVPDLDIEANELELVYRARGMSAGDAQRQAEAVLRGAAEGRPDPAQDTRHEIVGTGVGAAVSSFACFASGAAIPVLPFLVGMEGPPALVAAMALVGLGLLLTGATVGVLSGGPPLRRGMRQLAIGAGAAALTYALGLLVGGIAG
jgi:vacuolar iron transporter family protein